MTCEGVGPFLNRRDNPCPRADCDVMSTNTDMPWSVRDCHFAETIQTPAGKEKKMYKHICRTCELKRRREEFEEFSPKSKKARTNYATEAQVIHDHCQQKRGTKHRLIGSQFKVARRTVVSSQYDEDGLEIVNPMTRSNRRQAVMKLAKDFAESLLIAIKKCPGMFQALSGAGNRTQRIDDLEAELDEAWDAVEQDLTNLVKLVKYEDLLKQWEDETSYQALKIRIPDREERRSYLKCIDFVDQITDDIRLYNVCRCKN